MVGCERSSQLPFNVVSVYSSLRWLKAMSDITKEKSSPLSVFRVSAYIHLHKNNTTSGVVIHTGMALPTGKQRGISVGPPHSSSKFSLLADTSLGCKS